MEWLLALIVFTIPVCIVGGFILMIVLAIKKAKRQHKERAYLKAQMKSSK